jgi:uncharacterized membrane protein
LWATVTYDEFISDAVKVVEAIGAAIMILGGLAALMGYVVPMARLPRPSDAYRTLRQHLGRAILLGLEVSSWGTSFARSSSNRQSRVWPCWE